MNQIKISNAQFVEKTLPGKQPWIAMNVAIGETSRTNAKNAAKPLPMVAS